VNANPNLAGSTSPPKAPLSLASHNLAISVNLPSGAVVRLRYAAAKLFAALVKAGSRGMTQADCAGLTNHLPSTVSLLRDLFGDKDMIVTRRGDVRLGTATTYTLAFVPPHSIEGVQ
jgi:hypothetical protein